MPAPKDPEKYKEWIRKISESNRRRTPPMLGKHHNEKTKRKISEKLTGRKLPEETLKKMSVARMGHPPYFKSHKHTEEAKRKISLALKGNTYGFKKGQDPWNKGKKGYMSANKTSFKKGNEPWNKGKNGVMPEPWNKGLTKETDPKVAKIGNRKPRSEETRKKLSVLRLGKEPWMKGKKHTEEVLEKLRESRAKQKIPVKDTKIELQTRRVLDTLNIKYIPHYMVNYSTFGHHPVDIMVVDNNNNPSWGIECDGCVWHSCPEHRLKKHNMDLDRTKTRDRLVEKHFEKIGIPLIRLWEHDIKKGVFNLEIK